MALSDGPNTIAVVATDAATNTSTVNRLVTKNPATPPPDPSTVAPPLSQSVASTIGAATSFLYTGPNAIQTGVAPGTISATRAAVLRGRVLVDLYSVLRQGVQVSDESYSLPTRSSEVARPARA